MLFSFLKYINTAQIKFIYRKLRYHILFFIFIYKQVKFLCCNSVDSNKNSFTTKLDNVVVTSINGAFKDKTNKQLFKNSMLKYSANTNFNIRHFSSVPKPPNINKFHLQPDTNTADNLLQYEKIFNLLVNLLEKHLNANFIQEHDKFDRRIDLLKFAENTVDEFKSLKVTELLKYSKIDEIIDVKISKYEINTKIKPFVNYMLKKQLSTHLVRKSFSRNYRSLFKQYSDKDELTKQVSLLIATLLNNRQIMYSILNSIAIGVLEKKPCDLSTKDVIFFLQINTRDWDE